MLPVLTKLVELFVNAGRQWLPGIFGRVLSAWGVGLTTTKMVIPALLGLVQTKVSALPPTLLAYFGALGLDVCFTLILSAIAGRYIQKAILAKVQMPGSG